MSKNIYYDYNKVLSYSNALLYFIIGERGVGKTYGITKIVINKFLKTGRQFAYVRRYASELKSATPKFFDAIIANNEFPNHKFKCTKDTFYIDDKIIGFSCPLSQAVKLKGSTFSNVDTIIFDEFILERGVYHYLQDEVHHLLSIIESIGRLRDIRVILLGNAGSTSNPYFDYFNLSLPYNSDIKTFKNGLIVVNYIKNEPYREIKRKSKFGQLISGTEYEDFAINNKFLYDNFSFVRKRTKSCKFFYILYINHKVYGIWIDKDNRMFISEKYEPNCYIKLTFNTDDHDSDTILQIKRSPFIQNLLQHYRIGMLFFENMKIKNNIMPFINKNINR